MRPLIILSMMLFTLNAQATKNQPDRQVAVKAPATNDTQLLDQLSQPAEDATHIKVIVMKNQTIEEYRQKGELVLVKVIPDEGKPYFIDPLEREKLKGTGRDLINSGVKPVHWVLKEF